jgi:hypothetical protein
MADFVDNFFGNSFDDPKSQAVMALASGLMGGDWRKGVNGYLGAMGTAGEYNSKKQLQQAQMQEMMVKAAAEKQKMEMDAKKNKMLMDMLGGGQPSQASSSGLLGDSAPQGGLLGGGAQGGGDPFAGVDKRALMLDYLQNGGKNMGGWINDTTKPNWVNIDGNLVNTNAKGFSGGFQPGVKINENGQAIMRQPDGKGGVIVGAAPGSLDTFAAFESIKAGNKPIKVYNPETGREEYVSESTVLNAAKQPAAPRPMQQTAPSGAYNGYAGNSRANADAGAIEVLQSEINNPKTTPENKAAAMRELQRIRPTQGAQSGAFAAAPSQMEMAQAKATEAALVDTAKANVVRDTGRQGEQKRQGQLGAGVDRAIELLNQKPTASGGGALMDSAANFFGSSTKGADTASKLDTLSGWLVSNVPRMEGPQSDKDVLSYKTMAAEVGDRTKPISQRLAAAQELKALQAKYADLNGGGQTKEPKPSRVIDTLPPANTGNRGQRIRDTTTGKILKSNGISWVAE